MTQGLDLDNNTRLLVVVPHPDDETLATGGLIQIALAAGASLRVVIVTDGDDNPWPQRWIEKRWRIDAEARRRWGHRRRKEAATALARLGVAGHDIRHCGWPDQGLTDLLMRDAQCEDQLVAEIVDFAPSLIVAPSLADRHPDHSALRVMLELALARTSFAACRRLCFVVHGSIPDDQALAIVISEEQARIKQHALLAHASQLVLSGKRMNRLCQRVERFESPRAPAMPGGDSRWREWQMPRPRPAAGLHRYALRLLLAVDGQVIRTSVPLPTRSFSTQLTPCPGDRQSIDLEIDASANSLRIRISRQQKVDRIFAKIDRVESRIIIHDHHGWVEIQASAH